MTKPTTLSQTVDGENEDSGDMDSGQTEFSLLGCEGLVSGYLSLDFGIMFKPFFLGIAQVRRLSKVYSKEGWPRRSFQKIQPAFSVS